MSELATAGPTVHQTRERQQAEKTASIARLRLERSRLFRSVFETPQGGDLLQYLEKVYCLDELFDPDPRMQDRKVAQADFVRMLRRMTDAVPDV